ncbi:hypothetical protein D8674_029181 [Pyrus ussuriensis x Pyrus communis]|uniref:Uncharacterized protein n=1 Tax=Pyrus ussuriensis x Pyrus communis TaxID=2448454 RepID=A0A5N5IBW8_9ROSA|nr:hypothetical protein D8674_029181 [Pyrus ussuriensis x Pyrus communis]
MKSNIGVVGTSSAVMMVMLFLLINGSAMANEKCRQRCYGGCGLPPTAECVEECQKKCGNNAQPQSLADQVTQYCKLGCSLHRCSKYKNGMYQSLLMHTCLECWKPLGVVEILKVQNMSYTSHDYNLAIF